MHNCSWYDKQIWQDVYDSSFEQQNDYWSETNTTQVCNPEVNQVKGYGGNEEHDNCNEIN